MVVVVLVTYTMAQFMLCLNNSLAMIYGIYDDNINTYLPICYILRLVSIGRYLV